MKKPGRPAGLAVRVLFSLALFLLGLEIILRLFPWAVPAKPLFYFEPTLRGKLAKGRLPTRDDTILLHRDDGGAPIRILKPFAVKPYGADIAGAVTQVPADEIGFANPPGVYTNSPAIEILAIGDSFTWPTSVKPENSWPVRLGSLLGRSAYNLGRGGNGPYEYLQILKRYGLPKSPRIVVMNLYEGNDGRDITEHLAYLSGNTIADEDAGEAGKTGFLWRHSRAWNLVAGTGLYLLDHQRAKRSEGNIDYRFRVGDIPFNRENGSRDEIVFIRRTVAGEFRPDGFDEPLREFRRLADANGFAPVLSYVPMAATVYAPVAFRDPGLAPLVEQFSRDQRDHLRELAAALDMPFVDHTPALRRAAAAAPPRPENLLYFPRNLHLTARGHAVVAESLAAVLRPAR